MYAFFPLQESDDVEEILRLGIPIRAEHAHQTFRGALDCFTKFAESDCRVDTVAQHRFPGIDIAREKCLDSFNEQRLAEGCVTLHAGLNGFLEVSRKCHNYFSWSFLS